MKQSTPRKDIKRQAASARKLIASSDAVQRLLDVTIEFMESPNRYDSRDVIYKPGRRYDLYYIRSSFDMGRYYYMMWDAEYNGTGAWKCSCPQGCRHHKHHDMLNSFIQESKVSA